MILAVRHAQIMVPRDAEAAAREFYCDVLGLKEIPKPEPLRARGGFWLELGDFQIHVGLEDGVDRSRTRAHLAYEVEDLEQERSKLTRKNIAIQPGESIPGCRRFEFRDRFGNRVEFLQAG
jgi:catechol 2,3-dioxygenase-like lactoylglutathione lyase family enzyme